MKDSHKILGVPKNASKMTVKAAFRRLAKKWHPDKDKNNPLYHQKFQEINEAYSALMKSKDRRQFNGDDIRNIFQRMRQSSSGYYSTTQTQESPRFADVLDKAKAETPVSPQQKSKQTSQQSDQHQQPSNRDIRYTVSVSPQDAANGTKKRIRLFNGRWVDIKVPADTKNGQVLRLRGKGLLKNGVGRGDLLMVIQIDSPEIYRMEGDKVYLDIPITLSEAINGADIPIPTLAGTVLITVPPEVNNGYVMRIKGKGMLLHEEIRGDLFAIIRIVMPPNTDKKFQDFITEWSEKNPYRIREHFEHLI